jgi:diguanylate cyclase (GGDEF)-like protein
MKNTDKRLIEQMRITDLEITYRKDLFSLTADDIECLKNAKPVIEDELNMIVERFYQLQTAIPDIALLIGDADTLHRLHNAQKSYILDLFSGYYDIEYVNNRLRIGLVHKRIGVKPKLYLAAILALKKLLIAHLKEKITDQEKHTTAIQALEKLLMFDVSLVFDTYIRSLVSEIEISKRKSEQYANLLELKVKERTEQLEMLSMTDTLTGFLNRRHFDELIVQALRAAQRRDEPITLAYIDINDFKIINDTQGHREGDEILQQVASVLKTASRTEDLCFRYGGDEFCIVMSNCTIDDAQKIWGKRVIQILEQSKNSPKLSIGYAQTGPHEYLSFEKLIDQADSEMYAEKARMKEAARKQHG